MTVHIRRHWQRPAAELVAAYAGLGAATVHEAAGRTGALHSAIKPVDPAMWVCGPALPVFCHPGDNLMLLKAIDLAQPGDVLVTDAGGTTETGSWGELTTLAAQARGIAGLVIDGGLRDSAIVRSLGFPAFSRSICIRGTVKETLGRIGHPVACGGVAVNPGDLVLGDADGVVVVRQEEAAEVLHRAREREEKEQRIAAELKAGRSLFGLLGLDEAMRRRGCVEE